MMVCRLTPAQQEQLRAECATGVTDALFAQKLESMGHTYCLLHRIKLRKMLGIPLIRRTGWKWSKNATHTSRD